jgi:two-component system sporulation sensor kinase B
LNDEKNREYVSIAISEMDRAENIIRNFLTYAKPEIKVLTNVCLAEEIKKVLTVLQPLAHQNAVQVFFDCHSSSIVAGESTLIQQCFLNLCKNAIEAMESGGTLSIYLCEDCNNIYVDIHDNGIGMSEELLKNLGKPFYSTKGDKGTGLGLFATYTILEKLNAAIKVTSKVNSGTMFSLSFPLIYKVEPNKEETAKIAVIYN